MKRIGLTVAVAALTLVFSAGAFAQESAPPSTPQTTPQAAPQPAGKMGTMPDAAQSNAPMTHKPRARAVFSAALNNTSSTPLTNTMAGAAARVAICRAIWMPSMSGIIRSQNTISIARTGRLRNSMASRPLVASRIERMPADCNARLPTPRAKALWSTSMTLS